MAETNSTKSMLNARTLTGLILNEFLNQIEIWAPKLAYVYDEALTYETAVEKWRSDREVDDNVAAPMPLFAFKRTVLTPDEDNSIGKRAGNKPFTCTLSDGSVEKYKGLMATFDIEFLYLSRSMEDIERFEVSYLVERSVSHIKSLDVKIPDLADNLQYNLRFGNLDEKIINTDNSYYKALSGTFSVNGLFLSFEGVGKEVRSIEQKTSDFDKATCTPTVELDTIVINKKTE